MFDETPLVLAIKEGHSEIVQLLLSQPGIDYNYTEILKQKFFTIF